METLKFKDEVGGKIIHSIVALKSKLYSIAMGDQQKISAKGTTKHAQKNLQHSVFYRILEKETLLRTLNYTINSERHNLFTLQTTKISLSCFDDKRYIMPNGVDTLPFGHYSLRDDVIFREIGADCDWGDEEEDFIQSPIQSNSNQPALFSPPDPGLNQDAIEESELPDVIDLTELSDFEEDLPNTQPNVFLDCEAVEVPTRGPPPQKKVKFYIDNELQ